jgi:hypothetical protein
MTEVFKAYMDKFLKVFVDDLNVHNVDWEEHLKHLQYVLMRLREVNLEFNPRKCEFAKSRLTILGHEVSRKGTQPYQRKIKVVTNFPIPTSTINVQAFLGLTRYYRNYMKGYSHITIPLFKLTKKDYVFKWNPNYYKAFEILKSALVSTLILIMPNFTRAFILDVEWSTHGVGAIFFLSQP